MPENARTDLYDCPFDVVTSEQALERCLEWCRGPRASHTLLTINAALLCMKRRDRELDGACRNADLVVADGVSVMWASRLLGDPLPQRIAGVDFMVRLLEAASQHCLKVFFLGAKQEVLDALVARTKRDYPNAEIAGVQNGYFKEADHERIIQAIHDSGAHILFIGMPSPFKEVWSERYRERLNVPVIMGVGGSFDVLAGFIKRAPKWVQGAGMEWSWRLAMEPKKLWKRYLYTNSEFLWLTAGAVLKRRLHL
jgi:N-acetylglucosaminyldiphosphoundecaprenol N-acetyl-beta-D-mannosaminyltransferase